MIMPELFPNPCKCGQAAERSSFPCKPVGFQTNRDIPLIFVFYACYVLLIGFYFSSCIICVSRILSLISCHYMALISSRQNRRS